MDKPILTKEEFYDVYVIEWLSQHTLAQDFDTQNMLRFRCNELVEKYKQVVQSAMTEEAIHYRGPAEHNLIGAKKLKQGEATIDELKTVLLYGPYGDTWIKIAECVDDLNRTTSIQKLMATIDTLHSISHCSGKLFSRVGNYAPTNFNALEAFEHVKHLKERNGLLQYCSSDMKKLATDCGVQWKGHDSLGFVAPKKVQDELARRVALLDQLQKR